MNFIRFPVPKYLHLLTNLKNKTARFSDVTEVNDMENYVLGALGID